MANIKSLQKRQQARLNGSAKGTYSDPNQGLVITGVNTVTKIIEPVKEFLPKNKNAKVMYVRPLSFSWAEVLKYTTNVSIWSMWAKRLKDLSTRRMAQERFGENVNMLTRANVNEHVDKFRKETGKALVNAKPQEIEDYVKKYIGNMFALIVGNLPFGHDSDTQGQYICWPILLLNFFMLDKLKGVMIEIIPASLFAGFQSGVLKRIYDLILPKLEFLDMDVNEFFKQAGNAPGISMVAFTVRMSKTDSVVKVRRNGKIFEVEHSKLKEFLDVDYTLLKKIEACFSKTTQLRDIFICDVLQTAGKHSGGEPCSQGAMKKAGIISLKKDSETKKYVPDIKLGLTEPFYYSSPTVLYTSSDMISKYYSKTTGKLTVKFNYSGYLSSFGKDAYYMPIDTIPVGKCVEGVEVANVTQGLNVRTCYTRKLPLFFCEGIKGNNAYNGGMYLLPWFENCKKSVITDNDWYTLAGLDAAEIEIIEKWYKESYEKQPRTE
jgi:hypothetical protein